MDEEKFNVHQFFADDSNERVLNLVSAKEAVEKAYSLRSSVGAQIGTTKRVIITDGGDLTLWDWTYEKGLVFPLKCSNPTCEANDVLADDPCKSCGIITSPRKI